VSRARTACLVLALAAAAPCPARAQSPVSYRLTFPERDRHLMQVEATFNEVPAGTLELRMSRTSPGRYALHEFAKNVFDVRVSGEDGRALVVTRPNPHQWDVSGHAGTVRVTYKVFGDRVDGTYLGIDPSHAHVNMPAALMWARGMERRPAMVRFERPAGTSWRVATQLTSAGDAYTFASPNLQYLMDSPAEFGVFSLRTFTASDSIRTPVFRVAVHHSGTEADVDAFTRDVEAIVREARHVFREYPAFEGNTYTFITDYGPWAQDDAMEHRNSTFLTSRSSIRTARLDLLDSVAHEFFHAWNVERIRPRSLEPFNFEDVNMSGELWFAEGFTSYYAPLIMRRAGLTSVRDFVSGMGSLVDTVLNSPGRHVRSPVEMSQLAPFVDAAVSIDPTNFADTYVSYYTWGAAIGLGLDLSLRDRTDGKVTLDDVMRLMWERHGRPGGGFGQVDVPYTMDDLERAIADVSADAAFADRFFARYVEGRDVVDYRALLARAGLVLRTPAGAASPSVEIVLAEDAGEVLSDAQRRFREAWLSSAARTVF
jgi:predicted metalloprotease with PDZ domain